MSHSGKRTACLLLGFALALIMGRMVVAQEPAPPRVRVTWIGTATLLLEIGDAHPLRLLTDPALDPAGGHYSFGFGTGSTKTEAPMLPALGLGTLDAVLLSHDEHADNLDPAGRKLLPSVGRVITTRSGAKRLSVTLRDRVTGLEPWGATELQSPEGWTLTIHAVPARHGQRPLFEGLVGETVGFVLEWPGQRDGALYISGDTVFFRGIEEVGRRFRIGTAFLHLGGVRFPISGPLRYTFNGVDAAKAARALNAKTIVPIHYEGWTHFREPLERSLKAFDSAGLRQRVRILPRGETVELVP